MAGHLQLTGNNRQCAVTRCQRTLHQRADLLTEIKGRTLNQITHSARRGFLQIAVGRVDRQLQQAGRKAQTVFRLLQRHRATQQTAITGQTERRIVLKAELPVAPFAAADHAHKGQRYRVRQLGHMAPHFALQDQVMAQTQYRVITFQTDTEGQPRRVVRHIAPHQLQRFTNTTGVLGRQGNWSEHRQVLPGRQQNAEVGLIQRRGGIADQLGKST